MKLGMQIDYAGGFKESAAHVAELERAGLDVAWVAEAYGFDGPSFMGYLAALTETGDHRRGDPAHLHPHTDAAGHDRRGHRRPERRAVPAGARRVGPAGDRGLPRGPLRRPARAHPGDHRDLPSGVAQGAPGVRRPPLPDAAPARRGHGPGQAVEADRPPGPGAHPDLGRLARPQERRDDRRGRRRLAADLLPARAGRPGLGRRPRRRARPGARRSSGPLEIAGGRPGRHRRRHGRRRRAGPPDGRPLRRAAWGRRGATSTTT